LTVLGVLVHTCWGAQSFADVRSVAKNLGRTCEFEVNQTAFDGTVVPVKVAVVLTCLYYTLVFIQGSHGGSHGTENEVTKDAVLRVGFAMSGIFNPNPEWSLARSQAIKLTKVEREADDQRILDATGLVLAAAARAAGGERFGGGDGGDEDDEVDVLSGDEVEVSEVEEPGGVKRAPSPAAHLPASSKRPRQTFFYNVD
jgi:hypothetical protein